MKRKLLLSIRQMLCSHRLCSYEEWKQRPDVTDIRTWCMRCGHKSQETEDDRRVGKVLASFSRREN